jgi:CRISPR-associated protein Cas1
MYAMRFGEELRPGLSMEQLRGMEAVRIREAYRAESERTGVAWTRRSYDRGNWGGADAVNRALSAANSCLYAVCHAAIISLGLSPALGFIHTGKQLSFVYDIADFYKVELTIPMAFELAVGNDEGISRMARLSCRDEFHRSRILKRIVRDIQQALGFRDIIEAEYAIDSDPALPTPLWEPPPEVEHDRPDA